MAIFPCDWSAHRYPGPQRSVYITVVQDGQSETYKLRLCPEHFRLEREEIIGLMALVDENSTQSSLCENCHGDRALVVYASMYDQKAEVVYYAADLCATCWLSAREALKLGRSHSVNSR